MLKPGTEALPSIESLTPESDFSPFMRPQVDASLRRQALKTLFQDPRFNVMDGLDVYIDDYSKPDPLPEGWLEKMNQVARLGEYREPEPDEASRPPMTANETGSASIASDTDTCSRDAPEVPESGENPDRKPGDMV